MWLTMKYTPQPAFTFQYPAERRPDGATVPRGSCASRPNRPPAPQTCIVCDQCAKACPDDLIAPRRPSRAGAEDQNPRYFDFNLSRCSFLRVVRGSLPDQADQGPDHERGLRTGELQPGYPDPRVDQMYDGVEIEQYTR
jgi:NADH-quinone oxidoreductase subunit I